MTTPKSEMEAAARAYADRDLPADTAKDFIAGYLAGARKGFDASRETTSGFPAGYLASHFWYENADDFTRDLEGE